MIYLQLFSVFFQIGTFSFRRPVIAALPLIPELSQSLFIIGSQWLSSQI